MIKINNKYNSFKHLEIKYATNSMVDPKNKSSQIASS